MGVELADMELALVMARVKSVVHTGHQVVRGEIEGKAAVIQYQLTLVYVESLHRQAKQFLHVGLQRGRLDARLRLIRGAVSIRHQVNDGVFYAQVAQGHALAEHRSNAHADFDAIGMEKRQLSRPLLAMNGQVARFKPQLRQVPLKRAQLRSEEHTSELQSHVNLVCR